MASLARDWFSTYYYLSSPVLPSKSGHKIRKVEPRQWQERGLFIEHEAYWHRMCLWGREGKEEQEAGTARQLLSGKNSSSPLGIPIHPRNFLYTWWSWSGWWISASQSHSGSSPNISVDTVFPKWGGTERKHWCAPFNSTVNQSQEATRIHLVFEAEVKMRQHVQARRQQCDFIGDDAQLALLGFPRIALDSNYVSPAQFVVNTNKFFLRFVIPEWMENLTQYTISQIKTDLWFTSEPLLNCYCEAKKTPRFKVKCLSHNPRTGINL